MSAWGECTKYATFPLGAHWRHNWLSVDTGLYMKTMLLDSLPSYKTLRWFSLSWPPSVSNRNWFWKKVRKKVILNIKYVKKIMEIYKRFKRHETLSSIKRFLKFTEYFHYWYWMDRKKTYLILKETKIMVDYEFRSQI